MTSLNKSLAVVVLTIAACLAFGENSKATEFTGSCTIPTFELYQHGGGGGKKMRACSTEYSSLRDDPNLTGDVNWNDKASSIRTNGRLVSLYSDSKFQGSCIVVKTPVSTDGNFHSPPALNLSDVGFDDVVSSVRVGQDGRCRDLTVSSSIRPVICNQRSERSTFFLNTEVNALEARQCMQYTLPAGSTFKTSFGRGANRRTIEVRLQQGTYDFRATSDGSALELVRR